MKLETSQEVACLVLQHLSHFYAVILIFLIVLKPLRNARMNQITIAMVVLGLSHGIIFIIYDWEYPTSHLWRALMVWSGTSVLYLTTLQQLEIMKAFALLSLSITPHHVYLLQIAYSVMTIVISFGTLLEDTIAVFLKPIYPIFVRWGSLGRIIQLSLSLSIITSCSVYMLKLVHHSASIKRLAQLKTINKITLKTIYFLVVQILLDIASSTVFIQSYLIPVKTDIDDRKNNAYKRMASSVMLLRAIFQYVVFLGAVKMTFHKVQKPDQSPEQLLSKTKVINVD